MTTSSPVNARTRVVFRPIFSTVPDVVSHRIASPRRNGLSKMIASAANRSLKMPCAARPIAMPPMPSPATRPVTLTPRLSSTTISAIANSANVTSTRIRPSAEPSEELVSSAPTRCWTKPRISSRAQIAAWKAAAMMNRNWIVWNTTGGVSA